MFCWWKLKVKTSRLLQYSCKYECRDTCLLIWHRNIGKHLQLYCKIFLMSFQHTYYRHLGCKHHFLMICVVFLFFCILYFYLLKSTNDLCAINNCQVTIITTIFTELHIIFDVNITYCIKILINYYW